VAASPALVEAQMISVLIVDDHAMVRDGLVAVLDAEDDLDIVGAAGDVASATSMLAELRPDVLVTDYQLPDGTGFDLAAAVARLDLATMALVISGIDRPNLIEEAVRAGCAGFLGKGRDTADLAAAVRSVADGTAVFPAAALRRVVRAPQAMPIDPLTERELEVLALLARPMSVAEIAAELFVSIHTARNHVRAVLAKLDARSQLEAVVNAVRLGLVEIV
jgi:DNA-binding NarL/FixJ family response regulator